MHFLLYIYIYIYIYHVLYTNCIHFYIILYTLYANHVYIITVYILYKSFYILYTSYIDFLWRLLYQRATGTMLANTAVLVGVSGTRTKHSARQRNLELNRTRINIAKQTKEQNTKPISAWSVLHDQAKPHDRYCTEQNIEQNAKLTSSIKTEPEQNKDTNKNP